MGVIFLCGMTGAGKTTVGRRLAETLHCSFIDLDEEIERHAGRSITEIFEQDGEKPFRALEEKELMSVSATDNLVVALGAGALESPRNLTAVHERGTLVYLRANLETLLRRAELLRTSRPLLRDCNGDDDLRRVMEEMLARREAGYLTAERIMDVAEEETADTVADRIAAELRFE